LLSLLYSGQALLPALTLRQKGLVPATSGLSPLRDFHSIEFRPANIPVWLDVSRERLLRAPRPLRLRLRCQREKRCRSKVRQQVSALPPTWFIGFRRARLWSLSASRLSPTDLLPPYALPRSLRSLRLFPPARPAAGRLPAGAGHRAAVVILLIHRDNSADSIGCHQSERRWVLGCLTAIGVSIPYLKTRERYPSIYSIGAIEDLETFDYSSLRGNFGPTSAAGSARPSLSSTHYGLQRQCSSRVTRRSASVEKPPKGRHFHLAGFIMLINVGGAATEEPTAAAAAEYTLGKTVAIAADASTSTDFPLRAERNQKMPPPVLTFSASYE